MKNEIPLEDGYVLIVDDEVANVEVLQMLLEDEGFSNVHSTTDPQEALDICARDEVDLILLDLNMPVINGFSVMRKLDEMDKMESPFILMLTAQNTQEFRRMALDAGARDYVTKPFDFGELLARVRNLLEMRLLHKREHRQNVILEELVRKRTAALLESQESLIKSRLQVVQRLGRAAEYRDNETGYHILRMSKMSALLGKAAGLGEYDADLLLNASPMHDIGKIGIPDTILLKPGKFEPDEWNVMKTHAQIGADILSGTDSDLLEMAARIALTHHEKWDGSGYPNGLSGTDIPLEGRVCAVADVFDALTSERPYKKAWPVEEAVDLIREQSGKHFDPDLVELFVQHLDEMLVIKRTYSEPDGESTYSDVPKNLLDRHTG